jgi:hypothetical protein
MDVRRRAVICGLMAGAGGFARSAQAAPHAQALTLRQLVDASDLVADVVLLPRASLWVNVFGGRRIVTFWRLQDARSIVGPTAEEHEVVTLGGTVDDVQQLVSHEAALQPGKRHLAFFRQGPFERLWVTGMLQGAFELGPREGEPCVCVSPAQSEFLETDGSAIAALADIGLAAAERAIAAEWNS